MAQPFDSRVRRRTCRVPAAQAPALCRVPQRTVARAGRGPVSCGRRGAAQTPGAGGVAAGSGGRAAREGVHAGDPAVAFGVPGRAGAGDRGARVGARQRAGRAQCRGPGAVADGRDSHGPGTVRHTETPYDRLMDGVPRPRGAAADRGERGDAAAGLVGPGRRRDAPTGFSGLGGPRSRAARAWWTLAHAPAPPCTVTDPMPGFTCGHGPQRAGSPGSGGSMREAA